MAKQTKPKSKRTQVKDLPVAQQELTSTEIQKVEGGNSASQVTLKGSPVKINQPAEVRRDPQLAFAFKVNID
ncbi:MAG: hypothetical protein HOP19_20815 [Acidobacteria bacterium]|nr:hypothetical protein [Acidobacteriota bacterium]